MTLITANAIVTNRFTDDTISGNITFDLERTNITMSFNLSSESNITIATVNITGLKNGSVVNVTQVDTTQFGVPSDDDARFRNVIGFGDFDNDSYTDLIYANSSTAVTSSSVFVAYFNPTNDTWTVNTTNVRGGRNPNFLFSDIDNDTFTDVVVGRLPENTSIFTWNFTLKNFNPEFMLSNATFNTSSHLVNQILDYNNDGIADIATTPSGSVPASMRNLTILQGTSVSPWNFTVVPIGQTLGEVTAITDELAINLNNKAISTDLKNRSVLLVSTVNSNNRVILFEYNSSATNNFNKPVNWTLTYPISIASSSESNCRLAAGELNGSLPLEVVIACNAQEVSTNDEYTFVWLMKPNSTAVGGYNSPQIIATIDPITNINFKISDLTIADWNNDNDTPDIFIVPEATISGSDNYIYYLQNNKSNNANYTNPYEYFNHTGTENLKILAGEQIRWVDIDKDNDLDLIFGDQNRRLSVRLNYLYPSNVGVFINQTRVYNNTVNFNNSVIVDLNVTLLNNLIKTRFGWNTVDLNFSSFSGKVSLQYMDINITWTDITRPRNFNNLTNTTTPKRNQYVHFNMNVSDGANLSSTTFGWNGTTNSFINDSSISFSTTTLNYSFSVNKQTNWSRGTKITWRQYTNDSSGNWNVSEMSFIIANTLPSTNDVKINNTPITTNSANGSVSCSDLDNDTITSVGTQWFRNSVYNNTGDNQSLFIAANYTTDDTLIVSKRCYDGFDWSGWSNSSTVTVGDASPPLVPWYQTNNLTITTRINSTINFTINVTDSISNILSVNFSLNLSTGVIADKSFTIPSGQKSINVSYEIFKSAETLTNGSYNITNFRVCDSSNNCNSTTDTASFPDWRGLNFTVTQSQFPTATFELRFTTLTNAAGNTNNFTVRAVGDSDITTINFTLNSTTTDKSMTIPVGQKNVNVSYAIFSSDETLAVGSYNITNVRICDLSGFCNSTTSATSFPNWAGFSFTVTTVGGDDGGGGGGGGGDSYIGCAVNYANVNGICVPVGNLTRAERCGDSFCDALLGEDPFSCLKDCPFRAASFMCTNPAEPCLFNNTSFVATIVIGIFVLGIVFLQLQIRSVDDAKNKFRQLKNKIGQKFRKY